MTPTLPDDAEAWARAWRERLNDSTAFADAAADLDTSVLFEVRPDGTYDGDPTRVLVEVVDGACVTATAVEDADYDYALRGPYDAWKDLLRDDLAASAAVMGGPFDVDGNALSLMSDRDAFVEMVRAARRVDVDFAY